MYSWRYILFMAYLYYWSDRLGYFVHQMNIYLGIQRLLYIHIVCILKNMLNIYKCYNHNNICESKKVQSTSHCSSLLYVHLAMLPVCRDIKQGVNTNVPVGDILIRWSCCNMLTLHKTQQSTPFGRFSKL